MLTFLEKYYIILLISSTESTRKNLIHFVSFTGFKSVVKHFQSNSRSHCLVHKLGRSTAVNSTKKNGTNQTGNHSLQDTLLISSSSTSLCYCDTNEWTFSWAATDARLWKFLSHWVAPFIGICCAGPQMDGGVAIKGASKLVFYHTCLSSIHTGP